MLKSTRMGTVLVLVALVGVAWAGVTKIPAFVIEESWTDCLTNNPVALNMNESADGMAILNYAGGANKTVIQVIVSNFTGAPLDHYIVRLNPDVGYDLGTFVVDSKGNGHFHTEITGDVSASNIELWQQVQPPFSCDAVLIASGQQ